MAAAQGPAEWNARAGRNGSRRHGRQALPASYGASVPLTPVFKASYTAGETNMLDLVLHPDEKLRVVSEPVKTVNGDIARLAGDMIATMQREQGIGLAGVQVGHLVRVFVTALPDDKPRVFINPEVTATSEEVSKYEEGCLSFPGLYADVERSTGCTVEAVDENGKPFRMDADGMLARVIMHELDHLNGVLFVDYLSERKRNRLLKRYERLLAKARG